MQAVSNLVRESLPNYLHELPIPDSFLGWFSLGFKDWLRLVPFGAAVGGLSYLSLKGLANTPGIGPHVQNKLSGLPGFKGHRVNTLIKQDNPKVVDSVDIEDLGDKGGVFCRCWHSKNFPYCDGSHNKHNEDTGDNVGPLIVSVSKKN